MLKTKIYKVGIIDYGTSNLFSINHALKRVGFKTKILSPNSNYNLYDFLVLPGVGSFKAAMYFLKKNKIDKKIKIYLKKDKKNFLYGICLGMQLMFSNSEEFGQTNGLNLIQGKVQKFKGRIKTNIGWQKVKILNETRYFYHIHSYFCKPKNNVDVFSYTKLNNLKFFCSSIKKKQLIGTQFHPEKSGNNGINFLKNIPKIMKLKN